MVSGDLNVGKRSGPWLNIEKVNTDLKHKTCLLFSFLYYQKLDWFYQKQVGMQDLNFSLGSQSPNHLPMTSEHNKTFWTGKNIASEHNPGCNCVYLFVHEFKFYRFFECVLNVVAIKSSLNCSVCDVSVVSDLKLVYLTSNVIKQSIHRRHQDHHLVIFCYQFKYLGFSKLFFHIFTPKLS